MSTNLIGTYNFDNESERMQFTVDAALILQTKNTDHILALFLTAFSSFNPKFGIDAHPCISPIQNLISYLIDAGYKLGVDKVKDYGYQCIVILENPETGKNLFWHSLFGVKYSKEEEDALKEKKYATIH